MTHFHHFKPAGSELACLIRLESDSKRSGFETAADIIAVAVCSGSGLYLLTHLVSWAVRGFSV